jgi:uroporphyrinogen decarboxylase
MMSHRERLQACLRRQATDQVPVALWRHFPVDDQSPESLAAAHLAFQKSFDFDLLKVTPASSFCLKDWGVQDVWEGNPEGTRRYTTTVISDPDDWRRLPVREPSSPFLAAQLACLRYIRRDVGADTPVLQTVFSPLAQARHLAGETRLLAHLRQYPAEVALGLQTIAASTRLFVEAVGEAGADGIFFAVQHAQAHLLSLAEFDRFGRDFDLPVLAGAQQLWCNMVHAHGEQIYFDALAEYPVHILNWHDRETPPALKDARKQFSGALCAGLSRGALVYRTSLEVQKEAADAVHQTGGLGLLLSTGCVVPVIAPYGNLIAARDSVRLSARGRGAPA